MDVSALYAKPCRRQQPATRFKDLDPARIAFRGTGYGLDLAPLERNLQ